MLIAVLCLSIAIALIGIGVAIRVFRADHNRSTDRGLGEVVAAGVSGLGLRLDSVQQSFSSGLATSLESSSRGIVAAIAQVKDETRARIDERLEALSRALTGGFDVFREGTENRLAAARTETEESLSRLSATLEQRSALLQTQITTVLGELQRAVREELAQGRNESRESVTSANQSLLQAFETLQTGNERKLAEIRQSLEDRLAENIQKNIGAFKEMTVGIAELKLTSDKIMQVSGEISELTNILKSPKLRGDFGEFELENMLKDLIPPEHYEIKSTVNGALADAAILLPEGKLCIDSKFPLENYRRATSADTPDDERDRFRKAFISDAWGYIDSIAGKYIVPGVTLDIAFMFVPAESLHYQILLDDELQQHCREKKVLPVSPNTLYAYLQIIGIGFRGLKIQEAAKQIGSVLGKLKQEFEEFKSNFRLLGNHLQNAQNRFSDANISAEHFSVTLDRLHLGSVEVAPATSAALPSASAGATAGDLSLPPIDS
jgi:DNA recombination protein RmuC